MNETVLEIPGRTQTAMHNDSSFEKLYISLRRKEGRIYTDEELTELPDIAATHIYYKEWRLRKKSCLLLMKYLAKKARPLKILEAGCGNGWLAHRLATIPLAEVTGVDINQTELLQAKRVFSHMFNLEFIPSSINSPDLDKRYFDCVLFASSIQYFPSLKDLVGRAMSRLTDTGEVHIIDSPVYRKKELSAAREKTAVYFSRLGFPEMAAEYYHHSADELDALKYKILHNPGRFSKFIYGNNNPFPWICIKKQ